MADSMNKPAIQLKTLQWLKKFSHPGQDAFSLLASQLERGSEQENLWTLNKLEWLGKAAAEDLRCLKIRSEESDEIGLTGALVNSHKGKNVQYGYDDLFGFNKDPLPEDDSLRKFRALLTECQGLVNLLDPLTHSTEDLRLVLEKEDELMILMRRHKALCSIGLDLPASDEENLHRELQALFVETFKQIGFLNDDCEKEKLQKQMMTCAWVWENGPPQCVLISNTLENLSVRVYGVESVDCAAAKVQVKQDDAESAHKQEIKIMKSSNKARSGAGILLKLSKISIKNIEGTRKNQKNVRLCRVTCEIPVSTPGSVAFKCSSLPFIVRSGSTQLWAYTSSVIWFIWAQTDVRKPDSECPKELEMDSILTLIQARIMGAGLRLDNKALTEKVNVGTCSSSWPLHKLTDGERKGWADAVRDNCGSDRTRNPEMITRDNFIKHFEDKLFIWQIITAAVNTGIRLKKYNLDRFFHIGLSNDMCRAFPEMKIGDFILRSSLNRLDSVAGQCPNAYVIIQVQTEKEADPVIKTVDEFDRWNLKEIAENVFIKSRKNPCTILPSREDVTLIDDIIREKENYTRKLKPYKGSKQEQNPPAVNLSETCESMENLSLHSSQIQSLDLFNAQQNDTPASSPITEREEEGPQTKKFAVQEDMQVRQKSMQSFSVPGTGMTCQLSAGPSGLADTESLGLDSLEESPPSSLPGARTTEIGDSYLINERIISQQDEEFIMQDFPPQVLNDVLLSSGSGNGEPYIQIGQIPNMSPASMDSEDVWSPASENFFNGNGVGISETGFLLPHGL